MKQELQNQLQEALAKRDAEEALSRVVLDWKASGMNQQAVLAEFEECRRRLRSRNDEEKEDLIMDVMDRIVGWCPHHARFFE